MDINQGIREGLGEVPASLTASEIRTQVLSALRPKLEKLHHGFPYDWDKLVVRELKGWFDISNYPANAPVFLDRCMHESKGKERRRTFKKPTNPFELALVIDHEQWDQVQAYLDAQEHTVSGFYHDDSPLASLNADTL